jgi:hypothetical protein
MVSLQKLIGSYGEECMNLTFSRSLFDMEGTCAYVFNWMIVKVYDIFIVMYYG